MDQSVHEFPIEALPEEILLNIFAFVDSKTLKNSTFVCKKWNDIIGQSTALMKKLKLNFSRSDWILNHPIRFIRKYHMISVVECNMWNNMALEVIRQYRSSLRVLEFYSCKFSPKHTDFLDELFSSLNRIEELRCSFTSGIELKASSPCISLLKSVVWSYTDFNILKVIQTAQLTSLTIKCYNYMSSLIDFLVEQKILENLELWHISPGYIGFEQLKSIKFPLKRLSLDTTDIFDTKQKLRLFMSKFTETLEELELKKGYFQDCVYEMIFNKFRKLNTLIINCPSIVNSHNLKPNCSVRKLVVSGGGIQGLQYIIGNLPNIETLDLCDSATQELMVFISDNLYQLKTLHLHNVQAKAFGGLNIESLKSINISSHHDKLASSDWEAMVRGTPNVENFSFVKLSYDKRKNGPMFRTIAKGWTHLRHFKLSGFSVGEEFSKFLLNFNELQTVEIDRKSFGKTTPGLQQAILRDSTQNNFRFIIY